MLKNFKGIKLNRLQYVIINLIVGFIIGLLLNLLGFPLDEFDRITPFTSLTPLTILFSIPFVMLNIFRLKDIGMSPWLSLLSFYPPMTFLFFIFLTFQSGIKQDGE